MSEWISIKDSLPREYDFVLVFADNQSMLKPKPTSIARIISKGKWDFLGQWTSSVGAWMDKECYMNGDDITHWMPLPKSPTTAEYPEGPVCPNDFETFEEFADWTGKHGGITEMKAGK